MNSSSKEIENIPTFLLQNGQRFIELRLENNLFLHIIQGDLLNFEEVSDSIQRHTEEMKSIEYAKGFIDGFIKSKLFEGYKLAPENKKRRNRYPSAIIETYEEESIEEQIDPVIQKKFKIYEHVHHCSEEIEKNLKELELVYEVEEGDHISLTGTVIQLLEFLTWIYHLTASNMEAELQKYKGKEISDSGTVHHEEINVSTYHRTHGDLILKKSQELNLACNFGYDVILASGQADMIKEFKTYLHELEGIVKKSLYPKYWDFHETEVYSEFVVPTNSVEFQEVSSLFYHSANSMEIVKLTRIQNKYLMEQYITMLQKRLELTREININPNNGINRRLLFHGTKGRNPELIYKSKDTGFDLQYAREGMYGKGLYFAANASYPVKGYSHDIGNGRCQILLADVFLGKTIQCRSNNTYIKAPDGHDSIEATHDNFYVIYNNFHSYPLYLIEYMRREPTYTPGFGYLITNNAGNSNAFSLLFGQNQFNNAPQVLTNLQTF